MTDDEIIRCMMMAGLVTFLPIGIYHRLKSRTSERLDRRQEGLFILISLRLLGLAGMAGLLTFIINPRWMAWSSVALPVWLRCVSVTLGILAALLLTWTVSLGATSILLEVSSSLRRKRAGGCELVYLRQRHGGFPAPGRPNQHGRSQVDRAVR